MTYRDERAPALPATSITRRRKRRRTSVLLVAGVALALIMGSASGARAGWGGFLADADDHYAAECGSFWPTSATFATTRDGRSFSARWRFTLTQAQIDSLSCLSSRYRAEFIELDFRLFDFTGPNDWDGYTTTSSLPGAVHDVGWRDKASEATPGVTAVAVRHLRAGTSYTTTVAWSSGLTPVPGGKPRVSFELVPSYWAKSSKERLFCSAHRSQAGWCIFGQTRAYVSHGLRGTVSVPFSGTQSYDYPTNLGTYANHLVQWDGDTKAQKTAWLVTPDLRRLWVPDASTWNCLKSRAYHGPDLLQSSALHRLPDQTNMWAACGDSLAVNRVLRRNMYLKSGDGRYTFWLQGDGNLVLYGPSGRALWSNNRLTTDFLIMQGDGNVVGYTNTGTPTWASNTTGRGGNRLVVQNDGNLVLYSAARAVWASNTVGRT